MATAGALLLFPERALANGRFPAAMHWAIDPVDPAHWVIGTTFGLLRTRDSGRNFSWTCERVLNLADQEDPMFVITGQGTTVLATFEGILSTRDGCSYRQAPELSGEIIPDIAISPGAAGQVYGFRVTGIAAGRFDSELLRSDDGGESWARLATLPEDVLPLTLDVAASDPERIYLSARLARDAGYESVLLRSLDGGESFERLPIPGTQNQRLAFITAVHPHSAERLYVRVDDPAGTRLLYSRDAGERFEALFVAEGRLLGFALSPDGQQLAFGGPSDGLWVSGPEGEALEWRSDLRPNCLTFGAGGLYACASAAEAGFSLGRSVDLGLSFEPLLSFDQLCGPMACGNETPVGAECSLDWEVIGPVLGARCGLRPGTGGTGGVGGAAGNAGAAPTVKASGGGCSLTPSRNGTSEFGVWLALLAGVWRAARAVRRCSA